MRDLRLTKSRIQRIIAIERGKQEERRKNDDPHKIPSFIFVKLKKMPVTKKKTTKKSSPGNKSGRPAGTQNYSNEEFEWLFTNMERILPVGSEQWNQVALLHANKYPQRDLLSIRRKYNGFARLTIPTGDPFCPPLVKWARRIKWKIANKVELGHCEEFFDLTKGHPTEYVEPSVVQPSPAQVIAPPATASTAAPVVAMPPPPPLEALASVAIKQEKLAELQPNKKRDLPDSVHSGITSNTPSKRVRSYNKKKDDIMQSMEKSLDKALAKQQENFAELFKIGIKELVSAWHKESTK